MTINVIMENEKLNGMLNGCIMKTYKKFKLFSLMDFEEFQQETYVYLIPRLEKFDIDKSSLKTFITMVCMTCAKSCLEKAHGQSKDNSKLDFERNALRLDKSYSDSNEETQNLYDFIEDGNINVESETLDNILLKEILKSDCLSPIQRNILQLELQGYTKTEISKILNCSQGNVSTHFKKAKAKILMNFQY